MPKYVVISNDPPNSCPSSNKVPREVGKALGTDLPPMIQKYGI